MSTKSQIIEFIGNLPEDVTTEDIMAELYFKAQVDEGLSQLDAGQGIAQEKAEKRLGKWLSK